MSILRPVRAIAFTFGIAAILPILWSRCFAQALGSGGVQTGVAISKVVALTYPPLARAAHITGDVDLSLSVRPDGVVESVVVVSGHPLLQQAALTSVQQSHFDCRNCTQPLNPYRLVYTFEIDDDDRCLPKDAKPSDQENLHTYPRVTDAENRVTIKEQMLCILDPAPDFKEVRSIRCLFLWKCRSEL